MTLDLSHLALLLLAWGFTYLIHSSLLFAAVALLSRLPRPPGTPLLERLWKVALAGALLTATVQATVWHTPVSTSLPLLPAPAARLHEAPGLLVSAAGSASRDTHDSSTVSAVQVRTTERESRPSSGLALLAAWGLGALLMAVRYTIQRRALARLLYGRRDLRDHPIAGRLTCVQQRAGVSRAVRLTSSAALQSPVALAGDEICLPERALTCLTPAEQESLLAHELAHLVRRDPTWLSLFTLLEILLPFQLLSHAARRRWQQAAESLCDDWAAAHSSALSLARCLAEVAGWITHQPQPLRVAGMAAGSSLLLHRVHRLLERQSTGERATRPRGLTLFPLALLLVVACAAPGVSVRPASLMLGREVESEFLMTDDATSFELQASDGETDRRIEGQIKGTVRFNKDHDGVSYLSPNGRLHLVEWSDGYVRRLDVRPGPGGVPEVAFRLDGAPQPVDREWLARTLPLVTESAPQNNSPPMLLR